MNACPQCLLWQAGECYEFSYQIFFRIRGIRIVARAIKRVGSIRIKGSIAILNPYNLILLYGPSTKK